MSKTNAQHCCASKVDYHENIVLGQPQKFIKQELTLIFLKLGTNKISKSYKRKKKTKTNKQKKSH